jgi:hypothetical protein
MSSNPNISISAGTHMNIYGGGFTNIGGNLIQNNHAISWGMMLF